MTQRRASFRLDAVIAATWRYAPTGRGSGAFVKGSVRDISCGGCSLTAAQRMRIGENIEVRVEASSGNLLQLLAKVVHAEPMPGNLQVNYGLRFCAVSPDDERAIAALIYRLYARRRNRELG